MTTTQQPEALRLAEWIESDMSCEGDAEIAAELRSLHARVVELEKYHAAWSEYHAKTEWVQATYKPKELGKHRADILRERIIDLTTQLEAIGAGGVETLRKSGKPS